MMRRREIELERVLRDLTLNEEERKRQYWWRYSNPKAKSLEARVAAFLTPSTKVAILKWAWIISLVMLVFGYVIIFSKLFPQKLKLPF